jgi:uncharacterized protein (DUF1330 family)
MSAYVVVHINPLDADKAAEYSAVAGPSVTKHGGEFLCKGPAESLHGDDLGEMMVVVKFADKDAARTWYFSEEYQSIIPVREQAFKASFVLGGE